MNKLLYFFFLIFILSHCSLNKNSKFWTSSTTVKEELKKETQEIFIYEKSIINEFNPNLKIFLESKPTKIQTNNLKNNDKRINFDGRLKKTSRYKFSKIDNFYQYEPTISFDKDNIIFFDNKGSILKFDTNSKLRWKKNYYSKSEKKLKPVLQFANNEKVLIVADNIAKYYLLDLITGDLIWSKNNFAPFNSQIKIYKDKFFIVDFSNTLRCYSLKNGKELWNINTESSLIRSQKKISMVIINEKIYFNNSIGDISAVDINRGELLWQLPTQSTTIVNSAFSLATSEIIADEKNLYFSNNRNQFFSIDVNTGSFNWKNKVNSSVKPVLIENFIFTVSQEGYLFIIDKNNGNILRTTNLFNIFNPKKIDKIKPVGFVVGINNIYLTTNSGRLLTIDISSGKTISSIKVDNAKISQPFIQNKNLFLIKDNAIIKLN